MKIVANHTTAMQTITKNIFLLLVSLAMIIGAAACEGPQGPTGSQGEQGPQGEQGTQGEDGRDGQDGEDGTANVVATRWIDYSWNSTNTPTVKVMEYTISEVVFDEVGVSSLSQLFSNGGVFLVYGSNYGTSANRLFDYEFRDGAYSKAYSSSTGSLYLTLESTDGSALSDIEYSSTRGNRFRCILIPAGVLVPGHSKSSSPPDYSDYKAVCDYYGIPD